MNKTIFALAMVLIVAAISYADIPNTLNYQGRLMDQSGQPVLDGQYTVTFRLYTAASGGNMVWEEQQTVATQNGYFNTVLGNATALTPSMFSQPLWAGMQIGSNPEMTPRQKLGTTAYAMTVADGGITTDKIADGEVTTEKINTNAVTELFSFSNPANVDCGTAGAEYVLIEEEIDVVKPCTVIVIAKSSFYAGSGIPAINCMLWKLAINDEVVDEARERIDNVELGSATVMCSKYIKALLLTEWVNFRGFCS